MLKAKLEILGNIGKIETDVTDGGKWITKFSVAVNFKKNGVDETDWYNCVAWEKTGQLISELCQAGTRIRLDGDLRVKKWEKDGKTGINVEVTVKDFDVLAKGKEKESTPFDE